MLSYSKYCSRYNRAYSVKHYNKVINVNTHKTISLSADTLSVLDQTWFDGEENSLRFSSYTSSSSPSPTSMRGLNT